MDAPVEPGKCPECNKWNTFSAVQCVWCHAPMPPTKHNQPKSKAPLYLGIVTVVLMAFASGAFFFGNRQQPEKVAAAPVVPVATKKPTVAAMPAPEPTMIPPSPSTVTRSPVVVAQPTPIPAREPELTEVAEWTGNGIKNTQTFQVTSNEWVITWATKPGQFGAGNFQIYVYSANGNLVSVAANVIGESNDSSIMRGAGGYYLTINSMQPYSISVSDYR